MRIARTGRPRALTPAFARRLRGTLLLLVALAVVAFGVTARHLVHTHTRRLLSEQARLCAAALVPGPSGDLSTSVERLQARYDRLIAVATLDALGHLHTLYPERPAHRRAVVAALAAVTDPSRRRRITAAQDGKTVAVSGIVVPLNGSPSGTAWKAVILLRHDSYWTDWVRATAVFGLLAGVTALIGTGSMKTWFDRRVTLPLRTMASATCDPPSGREGVPTLEPGEWRETTQLAQRFHRLLQLIGEHAARNRRMERETQSRLREHQLAFDRQLRRAKDQIALDPLTKLRNRTFLQEELEPLFQCCRAKNEDLSAIMIDVDNFKQYNDMHGHQVGDALMESIGILLRAGLRPTDQTIRYGGDEFLILLPDTSAMQAGAIAQRLVKLFRQNTGRLGENHRLSLSAGVASLKVDEAKTGQTLVAKADAALYAAKRRGKNTVARSPADRVVEPVT